MMGIFQLYSNLMKPCSLLLLEMFYMAHDCTCYPLILTFFLIHSFLSSYLASGLFFITVILTLLEYAYSYPSLQYLWQLWKSLPLDWPWPCNHIACGQPWESLLLNTDENCTFFKYRYVQILDISNHFSLITYRRGTNTDIRMLTDSF